MSGSDTQTQVRRAVIALREQIVGGNLSAGERVYEASLAKTLGLSRTPIREALLRLSQEGLLEPTGTTGYRVRAFSIEDVLDAIELRGVLEGTAARFAAERGANPDTLELMRSMLCEIDSAVSGGAADMDFDIYIQCNAAFHESLASLAGSTTIQRELERVTQQPFASPSAFLRAQEGFAEFGETLIDGQKQHHAIFEAIAASEGSRAEALAREHARLARRNLEHVLYKDRTLIAQVPGLLLVASNT
jgi:GntR family transcriptional regulator of vanillate catabolism